MRNGGAKATATTAASATTAATAATATARATAAATTALLCGLLLTGCGQNTSPDAAKSPGSVTVPSQKADDKSTTPPAPSTPPPTTPPPSPTVPPSDPTPPQGKRLVAATVSGGIDGRHRSVLVNEDGTYTTVDRKKPPKKGKMPADKLAELRSALAESNFGALPRVSVADPPVMDGVMTAVIYQGHEVATDGMKKVPRLDRVIDALPGLN
ncbi:hypothetical protein ACFYVL_26285 [Streptomyces sp. NPDC004111]|uniref:hypothetical protein n=1 Tax=Streptomyces sp. NPDC004111 TaxID=3364690 RepID=UPI0036B32F15